jgi:hypothetical protein
MRPVSSCFEWEPQKILHCASDPSVDTKTARVAVDKAVEAVAKGYDWGQGPERKQPGHWLLDLITVFFLPTSTVHTCVWNSSTCWLKIQLPWSIKGPRTRSSLHCRSRLGLWDLWSVEFCSVISTATQWSLNGVQANTMRSNLWAYMV